MMNYRTFYIVAGIAVFAFPSLVWVVLEKTDADIKPVVNAAPSAGGVQAAPAPQKTAAPVSVYDDLLAALQIETVQKQPVSAEPQSFYAAAEPLPAGEYAADHSGMSSPSGSTIPASSLSSASAAAVEPITISSGSASSGSSGGRSSVAGSSNIGSSGGSSGSSSSDSGKQTNASASDSNSTDNIPAFGGTGSPVPEPKSILEQLRELEPLPKVHYSWELPPGDFMNPENQVLYELARITHAVSVSGARVKPEWIDSSVYTCARINKTNPEIPCTIGLVFNPWEEKFMPELGLKKPIPADYNYTIFNNHTYQDEINFFVSRSLLIRQWISQSNKKYGSDVKVGALLLDCERFHRRPNDPFWNTAVAKAVNEIHTKAVEIFPEARIEWYERAGRTANISDTATGVNVYFFYDFIMTGMSMSWYSPTKLKKMENLFQEDCDFADTYQIDGQTPWKGMDMTPWVALAWGFDWARFASGVRSDNYKDWDYDLSYSYQMGALLNSFEPPYDRAKIVVFFPSPFRLKSAPWYDLHSPWGKHFVEYCKGAAQADN